MSPLLTRGEEVDSMSSLVEEKQMKIVNSTVLVTGASSGIGLATAVRVAEEGASNVILIARDQKRLEEVAQKIRKTGAGAHAYICDMASPDELEETLKSIRREVGVPNAIVNNAGAGRWLSLRELKGLSEIDTALNVPLVAAMKVTAFFLKEMENGVVVNITSPAAEINIPGACAYGVARVGMRRFTELMILDERNRPDRNHYALVTAGETATAYFEKNEVGNDRVPMRRWIRTLTPEQVAEAIVIEGIQKEREEIYLPTEISLLSKLRRWFPSLVQACVTHIFGWQPKV